MTKMPRKTRLRVLYLVWLFYCLHINIVYLTSLTTFLIQSGFEHQIQSVEELVESDVEYGFHEGSDKYFNDSTDEIQWRPLIIIADNVINRLLLSKSVVPKHSI